MDDAVAEGGTEFCRLAFAPRREETLLTPDLAPNCGERVSEGRPLLAVPSGSGDPETGMTVEAVGQQDHDGEQAEQAGRGAGDGQIGPLPLGFDTKVVADLSEGDLQLPALREQRRICSGSCARSILLAKSAGRLRSDQPGEVRPPGARRGVAQDPVNQAHKVHGGGRGDMLQVCLGLPEIARST